MSNRKLAAILSADLVGYSRLMGADESGTLCRLKAVRERIVDPAITEHGGRIVKTAGDGILCDFPSAVDAVRCAVAIQTSMAGDDEASGAEQLRFRIGINLGDVIVDGDDIFGDGVNVAARLETLAAPGGICISQTAYDTVRGELGRWFTGGAEESLKNIDRPVRVWHWVPEGRTESVDASSPEDQPTVAVIPFVNHSSDKELDFHADSMTEDVITLLARTPGFLVISRYSSAAFRGDAAADVQTIGRELGARYVVRGSIRPVDDRLRISVELADARSGGHLWSDRFESPLDEVSHVRDEVIAAIVAHLRPELTRAEVELSRRYQPTDLNAWMLYRRAGNALFRDGWSEDSFQRAVELYRRAIEKDPNFALAHGALSLTLAIGHMLGFIDDAQAVEAATEADKALELTGNDSEVLGLAGCAISDLGDHDRGIDILERAVELNPSNSQAWTGLGGAYLAKGEVDSAVDKLSRGIRISPRDPRLAMWGCMLAVALGRQGRLEEAITEARAARRRDRKLYNSRLVLAVLLSAAGRRDEAADALTEARRLRPSLSLRDVRVLTGRFGVRSLEDIWEPAEATSSED